MEKFLQELVENTLQIMSIENTMSTVIAMAATLSDAVNSSIKSKQSEAI